MRRIGQFRLTVVVVASVIVAAVGGGIWLSSLDSTVTRWHVPYEVVYRGRTLPLYDADSCLAKAEVQRTWRGKLRRDGTASGLPRFIPPGREVGVVYVQPRGYSC